MDSDLKPEMYASLQKEFRHRQLRDLLVVLCTVILVWHLAATQDIFEAVAVFTRQHESWELDEVIIVAVFLAFALALFLARRLQELGILKNRLAAQNADLQKAVSEIRQLKGLLPICAECKQIRDDKGYWHRIEAYIQAHSDASFTHSICPSCTEKLYPGLLEDDGEDGSAPG